MEKHISTLTDQELIGEISDCLALVGEVKVREGIARKELLTRLTGRLKESGDITPVEHNGYTTMLKREPVTLAWLEREFGFSKKDLPAVCFKPKTELVLDVDALADWLKRKDMAMEPTYSLTVSKKKAI